MQTPNIIATDSADIPATVNSSQSSTIDVAGFLLPKQTEVIRNSTAFADSNDATHPMADAKPLRSPLLLDLQTWLFALFTGAWLFMTIVYAWAVSMTTGPLTKLVPPSETTSLNVLRVGSEIAGILLASLASSALSVGLWASASSDKGISMGLCWG